MSKIRSVPRKQGRRPAGIEFVYFGAESLFARKLRACMNGIILSIPKENYHSWYMAFIRKMVFQRKSNASPINL